MCLGTTSESVNDTFCSLCVQPLLLNDRFSSWCVRAPLLNDTFSSLCVRAPLLNDTFTWFSSPCVWAPLLNDTFRSLWVQAPLLNGTFSSHVFGHHFWMIHLVLYVFRHYFWMTHLIHYVFGHHSWMIHLVHQAFRYSLSCLETLSHCQKETGTKTNQHLPFLLNCLVKIGNIENTTRSLTVWLLFSYCQLTMLDISNSQTGA